MGTDKQEEEDDGRVIADMSGIETPSLFAPFSGRKKRREGEVPKVKNDRPWEDSSLNKKERFWYAMGALKAALLIGLAYLAGLAAVILLLLLLCWLSGMEVPFTVYMRHSQYNRMHTLRTFYCYESHLAFWKRSCYNQCVSH